MKKVLSFITLITIFAVTSCGEQKIDNISPDNNQTEQPDEEDEFPNDNTIDLEQIPESYKIYYTSIYEDVVYPTIYDPDEFGAHMISNRYEDGLGVMVFDNDVIGIPERAFVNCWEFASVILPDSVKEIREEAFYGCSNLTDITLPKGISSILCKTFSGCTSLINITIPDNLTSIGDEAFLNCTSLTDISTLLNSVTSIGDEAFSGCASLTSITIPATITSIGDEAFAACTSLTRVTIGNGSTSI